MFLPCGGSLPRTSTGLCGVTEQLWLSKISKRYGEIELEGMDCFHSKH